MSLRLAVLLLVCAAALACAGRAAAGYDWPMVPWGAYHQRHPNYQPGNPNYPLPASSQAQPPAAGQYPWYGTVWGVPAYNWGYFGAHSYPTERWHRGYYGDVQNWGVWRRY